MRKLLLLMLILSGLTYHGIGQPLTNANKFFHNGKAIELQANAVMMKKALQIDAKKGKATNGYFILQFGCGLARFGRHLQTFSRIVQSQK